MSTEQVISWNKDWWDDRHDWPEGGEEWSVAWGDAQCQWFATIYPRIKNYLPAQHVLEIATGHGRWTKILLENCARFTGVDIAASAINVCRRRFSFNHNASFHVNNGSSLSFSPDKSVDFLFSMDSLVHAGIDAMAPYIKEFSRVLADYGVGFVHHSNMAEHAHMGYQSKGHRAASVSADIFNRLCLENGLFCISQETVPWFEPVTTDCFSLFIRAEKAKGMSRRLIVNNDFGKEVKHARRLFEEYNFRF